MNTDIIEVEENSAQPEIDVSGEGLDGHGAGVGAPVHEVKPLVLFGWSLS